MTHLLHQLRDRLLPILLGQSIGLLCGIIGVRLTSALITPEDYGRYGVYLSFTTIGMWVVHAGLVKYVTRHWATTTDKIQLCHIVLRHWMRKLPWVVGGGIGAAVATSQLTSITFGFVLLPLLIAIGLLSLGAIAQAALQAAREHWRDCTVAVTGSVSRTFAPLLLFFAFGSATGLYVGFCVHAGVTLIVGWWLLRQPTPPRIAAEAVPPVVDRIYTGSFFSVIALASWVLIGVNRWIAAAYFGDEQAGYFTLASNVVLIVPTIIGTAFIQLFQPDLFVLGDRGDEISYRRLANRVDLVAGGFAATSLAGIVSLQFLMPWLVGPLINETYSPALTWILPIGFSGVALISGNYYQSMLLAAQKERACAPVTFIFATVFIVGSVGAASFGRTSFITWLMFTPLLSVLLTRTAARHYFFKQV